VLEFRRKRLPVLAAAVMASALFALGSEGVSLPFHGGTFAIASAAYAAEPPKLQRSPQRRAKKSTARKRPPVRPLTIRKATPGERQREPLRSRDLICPRPDNPGAPCVTRTSRYTPSLVAPGASRFLLGDSTLAPPQVPPVDYTQPAFPAPGRYDPRVAIAKGGIRGKAPLPLLLEPNLQFSSPLLSLPHR
jgi:hypothetical protein